MLLGRNHGGHSSFVDENDCERIIVSIIDNITTDWRYHITGQRRLVSFGSCTFGVKSVDRLISAVEFKVGGQDVIDIIRDSMRQFGGDTGRIGAEGEMSCVGTTTGTYVTVLYLQDLLQCTAITVRRAQRIDTPVNISMRGHEPYLYGPLLIVQVVKLTLLTAET